MIGGFFVWSFCRRTIVAENISAQPLIPSCGLLAYHRCTLTESSQTEIRSLYTHTPHLGRAVLRGKCITCA